MARNKIPLHIIKERGIIDYQNSRGTAHLRMLLDAHARYSYLLENCESKIQKYKNSQLMKNCSNELYTALSRHIIEEELIEVEGIGAKLRERILSEVFKSRLDDLFQANTLSGIGEEKQLSISYWVRKKKAHFSARLEDDFPNKQDILDKYQYFIDEALKNVKELEQMKIGYERVISKLKIHIDIFQGVTVDHFIEVLTNPDSSHFNQIEEYVKGVFAEWEEIPLWFQRLVLDTDTIYTDI